LKKNLHFFIYGVAFFIVFVPIFAEQTQKTIDSTLSTILTFTGLLLLMLGAWISFKSRGGGHPGRTRDILILLVVAGVVIWMLMKQFVV
jgi:hypothetical protein